MAENYQKIIDGLFSKRYCLKSKKRCPPSAGCSTSEHDASDGSEFILAPLNPADYSECENNNGKECANEFECKMSERGGGESAEGDKIWEALRELKRKLNESKNKLSDKDLTQWHDHTKSTNPAGLIVSDVRRRLHAELCTQAWCKFYEILVAFPNLVRSRGRFRSLHLCEAPGAFVNALHYYLRKKRLWITEWDWRANSLNPYYEGHPYESMIADDRFIFRTAKRWIFGSDDTGDVTSPLMLDGLLRNGGDFDLVTADGSIDCQDDPNGQERLLLPLHYCEVVCALSALCDGGNFVLKRFTMFERCSISLLYLLCCLFQEVHLFKPATSKSGNSEVYVVCESYRRLSSDCLAQLRAFYDRGGSNVANNDTFVLPKEIPLSFLRAVFAAENFFMDYQLAMVHFNLDTFRHWTPDLEAQCAAARQLALDRFLAVTDLSTPADSEGTPSVSSVFAEENKEPPWLKSMPWQKRHGTYEQRSFDQEQSRVAFQNILDELNLLRERLSIGGGLGFRTFIIHGYSCPLSSSEWYENELQPEPVYGRRLSAVINSKLCHASLLISYKTLRRMVEVASNFLEKGSYELESLELCQFQQSGGSNQSVRSLLNVANDQDCVWIDLTSTAMTKLDWLNFLIVLTSSEKPPQSVELTRSRLLILTRFSANVLVILCACYEQVTLIARNNPAGMCTIKAENYRRLPSCYAQNFTSYLRRVKYGLSKLERSRSECSMDLLQFLPMQYLAEPTFYKKLQRFNSTVLLGTCEEMLSVVSSK